MADIRISVLEKDGEEYFVPTEMDMVTALEHTNSVNLVGTERQLGWNDIVADIVIRGSGSSSPNWQLFRNGLYGYTFQASGSQECWLSYHMRHDYAVGTAIFPHIHFGTNTTSTGVVRFGVEYSIAKGYNQGSDSEFSPSSIEYIEYNISSNSQYKHLIAENPVGILSGKLEVDSLILVRVFRDGNSKNDTFPQPVYIFNCDIHHQVDRTTTLNRNPDFYQ